MTLHICILGIDGSGKSTIAAALPAFLAANGAVIAGSATGSFRVVAANEDLLAPDFRPAGLPIAGRLAICFRSFASRLADHALFGPLSRALQLLSRDNAARTLAQRYSTTVFVTDDNACLSMLRAAGTEVRTSDTEDIRALFSYIFDDVPVPKESRSRLPKRIRKKLIFKLTNFLGLRALWLPDVLIFLDLSPAVALTRLKSQGQTGDRQETLADLSRERTTHLRTVEAFDQYRLGRATHFLHVDDLSIGEIMQGVLEAISAHMPAAVTRAASPLNATDRYGKQKNLNRQYMSRYLLPKLFRGAWREPAFLLSPMGRRFRKEGYSAGVMRAIYQASDGQVGLADRIFFDHPLHRAFHDRLKILSEKISHELKVRLSNGHEVSLLTTPAGLADEILGRLEEIELQDPDAMKRVHLVAVDLDPEGELEDRLKEHAQRLGIQLTFLRGDVTNQQVRSRLEEWGPFDLAVSVGLSNYLPKHQLLLHLASLRNNLLPSGRLITDCFSPQSYALSRHYRGYEGNYYSPEMYLVILDYCGFDGLNAEVESEANGINHVVVATPRVNWQLQGNTTNVALAASRESFHPGLNQLN